MSEPLTLTLQRLPVPSRPAVEAIFALDRRLEALARRTRDPMVAQMRLTWWAEALAALDAKPAPAEPLLQSLADQVVARGVSGATLAVMADGWGAMLDDRPLDDAGLSRFAVERGGTAFEAVSHLLGQPAPGVGAAGAAWALADLAASVGSPERGRAVRLAQARWQDAVAGRWPRGARPLGELTLLTLLPIVAEDGSSGGVAAAWRMARFRLTGR